MTVEGAGTPRPGPEAEACLDWLRARGLPGGRVEPLAGDVSARRYFRLHGEARSRIVVSYPAQLRPACARFVVTARLLREADVRTPEILDADCTAGFMLLEDLGSETLEGPALSGWLHVRPWMESAVAAVDRIRALDPGRVAALQPPLDAVPLLAELEQTWTLVLEPRRLCGSADLAAALRDALARLVAELTAPALEPCHRDFMARNLVPLSGGGVAVLDHQDLRLGPPLYDLASLTNDTLYPPPDVVEGLLGPRLEAPGARLAFHRAAAQRALKIAGTFEAFRRRGDSRHVRLIRPSLEAALHHMAEIPETAPLVSRLARSWSPPPAALLD